MNEEESTAEKSIDSEQVEQELKEDSVILYILETKIEALHEEFEQKLESRDEKIAELETELENEREQRSELKTENEKLHDHVAQLTDRVDNLKGEKEHLESENRQLRERVDDLEETQGNQYSNVLGDIVDLESRLEDLNPTPKARETGSSPAIEPETHLETVVLMPERIVDRELTANQKRARFIAKDVREYSRKVPAGRMIDSGDLRRVLSAAFDSGHTNTVKRVRKILDDLGEDEVMIVERRGSKKLIFDESLVNRLERIENHHAGVMEATA